MGKRSILLIVGGAAQGKRKFAAKLWNSRLESEEKERRLDPEQMADGGLCSWEEFQQADAVFGLQEMIRRILEAGEMPGEDSGTEIARRIIDEGKQYIPISDEVGCGIVPMDAFDREYREAVGRACCCLGEEAEEVWRVTAGIGQRIKP